MNIRSRIKKLEGFKKEALNFKLFKKIWPKYRASHSDNESLDADKAFDLYQRGLLESSTQNKIEEFDKKNSLYGIGVDWEGFVNAPPSREILNRLSPESKERYEGMIEGRMMTEQEVAKRQMMSGRHSAESFIPTSYLDRFDIDIEPSKQFQSLGPKESPIQTVSESGELISSDIMGSEAGSVWAPYILLYKGSNSIVAKQYADPNTARWVSSHPDISSGYGKRGEEGLLEVYDLRKVPKEKRNFFTRHVAKDTRGMPLDRVIKLRGAGRSGWGASPYYETIIEDGDLRKARMAKYKSLPGLGWMLVEGRNVLKEGLTPEEAREHLDILKSEANTLAKEYPTMYFYYNFNKTMDRTLTVEALKSMSEKYPEDFYKIKELNKITDDSGKEVEEINELGMDKDELDKYKDEIDSFMKNIKFNLLKKHPSAFSYMYYESEIKRSKLTDSEVEQLMEFFAENTPREYFLYKLYLTADKLGLKKLNIPAFIKFINLGSEVYFSKDFSDNDIIKDIKSYMKSIGFDVDSAETKLQEDLAEKDPASYFRKYFHYDLPSSVTLKAFKRLSEVDPLLYARFREYNDAIPDGPLDLSDIDSDLKPKLEKQFDSILESIGAVKFIFDDNSYELNRAIEYGLNNVVEKAFREIYLKDLLSYFKPIHRGSDKSPYSLADSLGFHKVNEEAESKVDEYFNDLSSRDPIKYLKLIEKLKPMSRNNIIVSYSILPKYNKLIPQALEASFALDPAKFLDGFYGGSGIQQESSHLYSAMKLGLSDLVRRAFTYLKDISPKSFLDAMPFVIKAGLNDLAEDALKTYAIESPYDYFINYTYKDAVKIGLDYINKIGWESLPSDKDLKSELPPQIYNEIMESIKRAGSLSPMQKESNLVIKLLKLSHSLDKMGYDSSAILELSNVIKR